MVVPIYFGVREIELIACDCCFRFLVVVLFLSTSCSLFLLDLLLVPPCRPLFLFDFIIPCRSHHSCRVPSRPWRSDTLTVLPVVAIRPVENPWLERDLRWPLNWIKATTRPTHNSLSPMITTDPQLLWAIRDVRPQVPPQPIWMSPTRPTLMSTRVTTCCLIHDPFVSKQCQILLSSQSQCNQVCQPFSCFQKKGRLAWDGGSKPKFWADMGLLASLVAWTIHSSIHPSFACCI